VRGIEVVDPVDGRVVAVCWTMMEQPDKPDFPRPIDPIDAPPPDIKPVPPPDIPPLPGPPDIQLPPLDQPQ
jgi:hypothetical protein